MWESATSSMWTYPILPFQLNFSVSPVFFFKSTLLYSILHSYTNENILHKNENKSQEAKLPLSKPRTSDAVEHKSGGRLGPITNEGRTVTKSIPFSLLNSHAAFSARIFDRAYHIFHNAYVNSHPKKTTN